MIVARLEPGRILDFEPQAGADMASRAKGKLNFELTGSNLQSLAGKTALARSHDAKVSK